MGVEDQLRITNLTNLPEPIFQALTRNDYSRGNSNYSVTQLIDSPRVRILRKNHDEDITEDCADMLWSVLGTSVHKMFEQHSPDGHIVEERLFAQVDKWMISGAIDLQRSEDDGRVTLMDYKCTSAWSVIYGKKEWDKQLNFYAWLAERKPDVEVSALQIVAVLRDWQRKKAEMEASYPQAPIVIVDIPLWSKEERDQYVNERVALHTQADWQSFSGEELPPCTDDERWKKPNSYAIKKINQKRAIKLFDSKEEAEHHLATKYADSKEHEIETRLGEFVRCEANWCRVADWCSQHNQGV